MITQHHQQSPQVPLQSTALQELQDRSLYHSANWLAQFNFHCSTSTATAATTSNLLSQQYTRNKLELNEQPLIQLAKTFMDMRDYAQVSCTLADAKSSKSAFLRVYAAYLALEMSHQTMGPLFKNDAARRSEYLSKLEDLLRQVRALGSSTTASSASSTTASPAISTSSDAFIDYLHAMILVKLNIKDETSTFHLLIKSINEFHWNWSAWMLLKSLITSTRQLNDLSSRLPHSSPLFSFFMANVAVELSVDNESTSGILEDLMGLWPSHPQVYLLYAIFHYHRREFNMSSEMFQEYYRRNPGSLECTDIYSNVLFLRDESAELSILAQRCSQIDRYRPETCCVIANFYALKNEHEKAIGYFKRALKISSKFNGAWTLMGHEYMELGNTKAALESYRRAVDADERDYRAWFGLGQTYEILGMSSFALYYYQKAVTLKPKDTRLWTALAGTFENLGQIDAALKCYKRATSKYPPEVVLSRSGNGSGIMDMDLEGGNGEFTACFKVWFKIAKTYLQMFKMKEAVFWYESALALDSFRFEISPVEWSEALMFVGKYYVGERSRDKAQFYLMQVVDSDMPDREEAKQLLKECR